jgi:predicted nucleic acid-binding protein
VRIFLDANILFSAAKTDGAISRLLQLLQAERHILVADSFVVEEARRNLVRKSSGLPLEALEKLLTVIEVAPTGTDLPGAGAWLDWLPPKDRPVLAGAVKPGCAVLITGDRTHFESGYGKTFGGVLVLSPAMAAHRLLA